MRTAAVLGGFFFSLFLSILTELKKKTQVSQEEFLELYIHVKSAARSDVDM